ncbi:hypothetical protein DRH13_03975 [Candidatus Woesebacteria bacterium]|nr:MAG: hypothetical protein DRH13_03975 [Candidatus Woesebacteria bacterium]
MNLNQLKIFYLSAKLGSLSAAARALYITQPAVTKGIQRLQEYYDIKFINHFGKKLALTDAGDALYEIAEKIFELEKNAEESIRDFQQRKKGHIRIHASESFGAYYLPSIIDPFSKSNPNIRISINILPNEQVVENVASLNNDLGFISYPIEHKKVLIREILEDRLVIIVPPDHAFAGKKYLTPRDLDGQNMIIHEKGSTPQRVIDEFIKKNKISIFIPMELSSNRAVKKAVEDGTGIALISRNVASEEIQMGRLIAIPLSGRVIKRKFYLVHHKDKYISESLGRLIEIVDKWAAEYTKSFS